MTHSGHRPESHQETCLSGARLVRQGCGGVVEHGASVSLSVEDVTFLPQGLPYIPQASPLLNTAHASSTVGTRQKHGTSFLPGKHLSGTEGRTGLGAEQALYRCAAGSQETNRNSQCCRKRYLVASLALIG